MASIQKIIEEANDEVLVKAFREIETWKYKTGILPDGIFRKYHQMFEEETGSEQNMRVTEDRILHEIGKRFSTLVEEKATK